jgi:nitrate/nitrite-specific signal transduction histidine kinase
MNGDGSVKLAILENPARPSPLDRAAKQGTRGAIDLLHKVLTQLLEDPDSSEPFDLLLSHILELSGAEAGAIFVSTDSGRQSVLLACNGPDDRERWMRVVRERDLYLGTDGRMGSEIFEDLEDPGSTILAQGLTQGSRGHGLLLLRLGRGASIAPESAIVPLSSYSEYLGGILYSARCARMKLRNALNEERAAIARELHDSLAQSLSYLKIQVSLLQTMLKNDGASNVDTVLQELRNTLSAANLQLRELITTFRLTMHGKTFAQALEDSIDEFERRSSIAFDLDNRLPVGQLTVAEEMQLLLILREALSNVVRHAHASYCWVSVRLTDDGAVYLGVDDDGTGMRSAIHDAEPHHGLVIMQERAHGLGGTLRIEEREGGGTSLRVHCPRERRTSYSTSAT